MKKTFAMILSALLLCGTAPMAFAEDAVTALEGEEIVNLGLIADEYIKGEHDMFSGAWDASLPSSPEYGFDGDWSTTVNFQVEGGSDYWFGVRFNQPTILTEVVFVAPDWEGDGTPDRKHCLHGCMLEGSNDGENWEFIIELGDIYTEFEDYMLDFEDGITLTYTEIPFDGGEDYYEDEDPEDPVAYTYYRVYNNCKGAAEWGDVELWGYFVETAETAAPETEAPETEAPETEAPETEAPETEAPETEAPETEAPETEAPETAAPETEAPATAAPETAAPETEAPETEAPETEAPATAAPETAAPETEAPAVDETKVSDEFHFYGELVDTGIRATAPAGIANAVAGTVMGAGATPEANTYAMAFDGNLDTFWAAAENKWAEYMLVFKADAPVAAQGFVVATQTAGDGKPIRYHALNTSRIQGSNDGINWTTLFTFGEWEYVEYSEEVAAGNYYYTVIPEDTTTEYTYFRYINNDDGAAALSEFAVLGAAAEAPATTAPETAAPETEAPATAAPETAAPETEAPATAAPETTAPTTGTDTPVAPQTFDFGVIAAVAAVVSAAGYAVAKKRK